MPPDFGKLSITSSNLTGSSTISSLDILPDDVLLDILELGFTHQFPGCFAERPKYQPSDTPLAISHVSRRFRHLASCLPNIWSCIHVSNDQPCDARSHSIVRTHVLYSQKQPLSVSLLYSRISQPHCTTCWDLLVAELPRWKYAVIHVGNSYEMKSLLRSFTNAHAPLLEGLDLWTGNYLYSLHPGRELPSDLHISFPKLTRLRVCSTSLLTSFFTCTTLSDLWLGSTYLQYKHFNALMLSLAPSLHSLTLCNLRFTGELAYEFFTFPRLRYLALSVQLYGLPGMADVLKAFETPSLTSLLLSWVDQGARNAIESDGLVFPTVTYFAYSEEHHTSQDRGVTSQFINAFPSLTHVQLCTNTADIILPVAMANEACWPALQVLTTSLASPPLDSVSAFLKRRQRFGRPLSLVRHKGRSADDILLAACAELQQHGVEVVQAPSELDFFRPWDSTRGIPLYPTYENALT